jgi:hypothetical protein
MLNSESIKIFCSYSAKDIELQKNLKTHLGTLRRQKIISDWDDRELIGGEEWDKKIKCMLNTADIILLLISADFIDSDYCYDIEVKRAMERHEMGEARVIPIILRPSDWKHASVPFNKLTAFPTGVEPVTNWSSQDNAFLNIADGIRKVAESLIKERKKDFDHKNRVPEDINPYIKKYMEIYGKIKIPGMRQSVDLIDIYTKVLFLDQSNNPYRSKEDLEKFFRNRHQNRLLYTRGSDGFRAVNKHEHLMVLGAPGAGKSTFLRRVGLEALNLKQGTESLFQHHCIPVLLEFKKFKSGSIDIPQFITNELNSFGLSISEVRVEEELERGNFLILFDGLDEVCEEFLTEIMDKIQKFVEEYRQNRFIASCRIASYRVESFQNNCFANFIDIELAEFDGDQIQQFINNWFCSPSDIENSTALKCWNLLNSYDHKASRELARTPLLLTYLCLVYDRTQNIPRRRAEIYRKALDILLEEWASEKRIYQGEIYQGFSTEQEKVLLAEIAYQGFTNDQLFFGQQEIIEQINCFLVDTTPQDELNRLDGRAVLTAIVTQQGILVERYDGAYSFSHLTFQEYLTAQYVSFKEDLVQSMVRQYLTYQRWREVFILVAECFISGDIFLKAMETKAKQLIDITSSLRSADLLVWADKATRNAEGNYRPATRRVGAILFALYLANHFAYDPSCAYALKTAINLADNLIRTRSLDCPSDLARNFANDMNKAAELAKTLAYAKDSGKTPQLVISFVNELQHIKIFGAVDFNGLIQDLNIFISQRNLLAYEDQQKHSDEILQLLYNALDLNPGILKFSEVEAVALQNYFYANELIMQCMRSSKRSSRIVRDEIEERMLKMGG